MKNNNKNLPAILKRHLVDGWHRTQMIVRKTWIQASAIGILLFVASQKEVSFEFRFGRPTDQPQADFSTSLLRGNEQPQAKPAVYNEALDKPIATNPTPSKPKTTTAKKKNAAPVDADIWQQLRLQRQKLMLSIPAKLFVSTDDGLGMNLANPATATSDALTDEQKKKAAQYSNLGFILNPDFAERNGVDPAIVLAKNQLCYNYVARFSATAKEEAELFNIPAAITIAQGLLESNVGDSNLAKRDKNHFGIKCRDKCIGCRCANYTDDSKFDMFRIFESDWESFREHSKLLSGARYKHLSKLPRSDYKNWAHGLKAAGYATDPNYATKLIAIIEALELHKLDN